jgi:hypothetical protein
LIGAVVGRKGVGVVPVRTAADTFAANVLPLIQQIRAGGAKTDQAIADALNARGVRTARGRKWHRTSVRNLLVRAQ